ncbi:MAG TPA: hypothetical protein VNX88_17405 [Terriglobales bacterium]|nr:hypothetical protein [Terriglobales bacterium]
MKRLFTVLFWISSMSLVSGLHAQQQIDAQFGISGMNAPSATNFDLNDFNHSPQSLSGGVYPSFAADFILFRNFGFNGEVAWRATRGNYQDDPTSPYRPIFYDFNAVYAKKTGRVGFVAMGGIGAESIRFYGNFTNCNNFGQCTNYVSSNHFMGHVGGGLRFYLTNSVYLAPEAHVYFVHNNVEFTSAHATRYGVNLGYTFGR